MFLVNIITSRVHVVYIKVLDLHLFSFRHEIKLNNHGTAELLDCSCSIRVHWRIYGGAG